jgi:DNA-binding response OmpR family regulator
MRVLLAEDDFNIALVAQLCLEKIGGHEVVIRDNGQSALDTALREPFDLILLDGMMPHLTGVQVATAIRNAGILGTPIIFLSAKTYNKDIEQFLSLGNGYIPKPFDPQSICDHILAILNASEKAA